jgi:NADH-quinone oxidoreductase subunit J
VTELVVFVVAAAVCVGGALGVVASSNTVHAALSLVATLFGVAVLFVAQEAHFLAAVQVIVYAGAIVVLFLFVIMFLGVDRAENLRVEPLGGTYRFAAGLLGAGVVALVLTALADTGGEATGVPRAVAPLAGDGAPDIDVLGRALFTRYVFAFELTSVLLVIAVVGAVLMASRPRRGEEIVEAGLAERAIEIEERIAWAEARASAGSGHAPGDGRASGEAPEPHEGADADGAPVGAGATSGRGRGES